MRIAIYDDLHIETDGAQNFVLADADVCVLAGDICVADALQEHKTDADSRGHKKAVKRFFDRVSAKYPHILYVMGNHEHYRGVFEKTEVILRDYLKQWDNITLLEKECTVIEGVLFFGATLWTSVNNNNPITAMILKEYLNDFDVIKRQGGMKWTPEMSYLEHLKTLDALEEAIQMANKYNYEKMVVISHHCPSSLSCDERFADELQGNFAYFSDLDEWAIREPIKLWLHGHVHVAKDYYIEDTRVVCNPRGYPGEIRRCWTGFNERKVVVI